jgi:hypothetical protein
MSSDQGMGRPWRIGPGSKEVKGTRLPSDNDSEDLIIGRADVIDQSKQKHGIYVTNAYSVDTERGGHSTATR